MSSFYRSNIELVGDTNTLLKNTGYDTAPTYRPWYANPLHQFASSYDQSIKYDCWAVNSVNGSLPSGSREALTVFQLWYADQDLVDIAGFDFTMAFAGTASGGGTACTTVNGLRMKACLYTCRGNAYGDQSFAATNQNGRWMAPGVPIGECTWDGGNVSVTGTYSPSAQTFQTMASQTLGAGFVTTSTSITPSSMSGGNDLRYLFTDRPTIKRGNFFWLAMMTECFYTNLDGAVPPTMICHDSPGRPLTWDTAKGGPASPYLYGTSVASAITVPFPSGSEIANTNLGNTGAGFLIGTDCKSTNTTSTRNINYTSGTGYADNLSSISNYRAGYAAMRIMLLPRRS